MSWIDFLERRFGHLAIPHLLRYVAALNGLAFVLCQLRPGFEKMLNLDPNAVMAGQVWRLFSHVFVPVVEGVFLSWLSAAFYLLFLMWLGDGLERAMGAFRLNLYYVLGMIGTTAAAFITGHDVGGILLNNSLVFAFACYYPDLRILFFFVIPMKIKWLAWLDVILLLPSLIFSGWGYRIGVLAALANFAIFFIPHFIRARRQLRDQSQRRAAFLNPEDAPETLHSCHICGRTEISAPHLEFRVARDGNEYCLDHIRSASVG
ncbi:MAG: hypothetical protein WCL08_04695 [Verrucomicrobiota bacterium]